MLKCRSHRHGAVTVSIHWICDKDIPFSLNQAFCPQSYHWH